MLGLEGATAMFVRYGEAQIEASGQHVSCYPRSDKNRMCHINPVLSRQIAKSVDSGWSTWLRSNVKINLVDLAKIIAHQLAP